MSNAVKGVLGAVLIANGDLGEAAKQSIRCGRVCVCVCDRLFNTIATWSTPSKNWQSTQTLSVYGSGRIVFIVNRHRQMDVRTSAAIPGRRKR